MKTFKEIALSMQEEINEKKMKGADKIKAAKALKKRKKTPEYKQNKKKQDICKGKIKPGSNKSCSIGDTTPTKIDKKRSKSSKIGSRSRH
jgi:hypothetical protein